jgi:hypothetical protein
VGDPARASVRVTFFHSSLIRSDSNSAIANRMFCMNFPEAVVVSMSSVVETSATSSFRSCVERAAARGRAGEPGEPVDGDGLELARGGVAHHPLELRPLDALPAGDVEVDVPADDLEVAVAKPTPRSSRAGSRRRAGRACSRPISAEIRT